MGCATGGSPNATASDRQGQATLQPHSLLEALGLLTNNSNNSNNSKNSNNSDNSNNGNNSKNSNNSNNRNNRNNSNTSNTSSSRVKGSSNILHVKNSSSEYSVLIVVGS